MAALGVSGGMYAQASFAVAQAKAKPHEIPVATGLTSLAQLTGGAIALAIANSDLPGKSCRQHFGCCSERV